MTTANKVISRALSKLGYKAAEVPLEAAEIQDGLDELNDMLTGWEPKYKLGFSPLSDDSDELRVPREAIGAIIPALAVRLAPEYKIPVSIALASDADTSLRNMLTSTVTLDNVEYPDTLPRGVGDCSDSQFYDDRFFDKNSTKNF